MKIFGTAYHDLPFRFANSLPHSSGKELRNGAARTTDLLTVVFLQALLLSLGVDPIPFLHVTQGSQQETHGDSETAPTRGGSLYDALYLFISQGCYGAPNETLTVPALFVLERKCLRLVFSPSLSLVLLLTVLAELINGPSAVQLHAVSQWGRATSVNVCFDQACVVNL